MEKDMIIQWWALREDKTNKIDYTLIPPEMLTRVAKRYTEWWKDHWNFNRLKWDKQFIDICKQSAFRHFIQWMSWESDEDHMAACVFNLFAVETLKVKLNWILDDYMKEKLNEMLDKPHHKELSDEITIEQYNDFINKKS